jgi:CubicO group peptidase (beta-lactamase class C family)
MGGGNMLATAEDLVHFGSALMHPGFLTKDSLTLLYTRPKTERAESPMSFGWFVSSAGAAPRDIHINGSNIGVQAGLYVYPDQELVAAILSNTWGVGSNSGEMVTALPERIAAIASGQTPMR